MSAWHSLAHAESAATGQSARSCPHFQVHVPVCEADCRQPQSALDPGARLRPGLPGRGVRGRQEPALAGGGQRGRGPAVTWLASGFSVGGEGVLPLHGGLRSSGVSGPGQLGPTRVGGLLKVSKVPRLGSWHEALGDHTVAVGLENSSAATTTGSALLLVPDTAPAFLGCRPESELRLSQRIVWSGNALPKRSFLVGLAQGSLCRPKRRRANRRCLKSSLLQLGLFCF